MGNFFAELKRRHVYRVAAAYAVVAWVLLQLVSNVAPILELPPWIARAVLLLLVLGFPVAVLLAWMFDATPEGLKRTPPGSVDAVKTGTADWILTGALAAVIALILYQQLATPPAAITATKTGVGPAAQLQPTRLAIAVLPFTNLSGDANQEFFSDGMTDEITAALTKVPNLRVVGRTSVFQFKGQNRDIQAISQALHASYVIDGSVRRAGDRVRITAQLIQADNGVNLWADNYDRQLTDVFATQEEIAQAIAGALRVPLGLRQGENLVTNRTVDLDSYQQYLRARALVRARSVVDAIKLLDAAVARDPDYAPSWGLLGRAYLLEPIFNPTLRITRRSGSIQDERRLIQTSRDKAGASAAQAIRLDARNPEGYGVQGNIQFYAGKYTAGEDLYKQALALDPNEPEVLHQYGLAQANTGRLKDSLSTREKLRMLEPFVPIYNIRTAEIMELNGQRQAALALLEATPPDAAGGLARNIALARAYAAEGRYTEAADTLLAIRTDLISRQSVEEAARLIRAAPTSSNSPQALPMLEGDLNFVYAHVGALDRILESSERGLEIVFTFSSSIWRSEYAPLRKTERFKALMRKAEILDYWRQRGWPDLCRPVGTDDFLCD